MCVVKSVVLEYRKCSARILAKVSFTTHCVNATMCINPCQFQKND